MFQIVIYLLFSVFSLGQLARVSFFDQQVNFYLYEILLGFILLFFFYRHKFLPIKFYFLRFRELFIFLIYLYLTFIFTILQFEPEKNIISFLFLTRLSFYLIFFIYLLYELRNTVKNSQFIKKGILFSILLTIIFSIGQYFFYPDLRNLFYLGWDPHFYRLFGTFFEPVILASTLIIFLLFIFFNPKLIRENFKIISMFLLLLLTILTFSRGVYLALIITAIIYFRKRNLKYILLIILLSSLMFIIIPKPSGEGVNILRVSTIESRLKDYQEAIKTWKKNPVFGVGYNRTSFVREDKQLLVFSNHAVSSFHSSFSTILVTGGIVGLLLFLWMLRRLALMNPFALYTIIFLSVVSLVDNVILHPFILFLLITSVAVSLNHPSYKK